MERRQFDSEHEIFRKSFREFLKNEVLPFCEAWEHEGLTPKEVWASAGRNGFLCPWAGEEYGGAGVRDFRYDQIITEELACINETGLAFGLHSSVVAPILDRLGNEEQRRRLLSRAVSGNGILAIAITEPAAGSDIAGITSRAELRGDVWVLNGSKTFVSNGLNANIVIVAAKTNHSNPRQIGLFIVEEGMAGFQRGRKLQKLGCKAQDTAELFFNDVEVPAANVLGDVNRGFKALMQLLTEERLIAAIQSISMAQSAFAMTLAYVKGRKAFGQPLADFQNTRFRLAEMRTEIDLGQVFVDRCVMEQNRGCLTPDLAAEAKLWTSELVGRVADECVQLHGGYGYMLEYPITRLYANVRVHRIWSGTSEIMKQIIAAALLK